MADITEAEHQDLIAESLWSGPPSHVMDTNPATGELSLMTLDQAGLTPTEVTWQPGATEPTVRTFESEAEPDAEYTAAVKEIANKPQMEYGQYPDLASEGEAELREFQEQKAQQESQESQQEQQSEQTAAIEPYTQAIERLNLKSPEADQGLAEGLHEALQLAPEAQINGEKMGGLFRILGLSAARHGPQDKVAPEVAQAITTWFYEGLGQDPRFSYELAPEQQQGITLTFHNSFANIEDTCQMLERQGIKPTVENVNADPMGTLYFFHQFLTYAAGREVPIDPAMAFKTGDKVVAFYLDMRNRAYASQSKPRAESRSTGRSTGRKSIPKFQTNTDIFDDEAMDLYQTYGGRLVLDSER